MPEAAATERGILGLLQAAWIRPLLLLLVLVGAWDLAIRLFHIPPYQIPAPIDVIKSLWSDWPELIAQAWPTAYATLAGFLLSALFGKARQKGHDQSLPRLKMRRHEPPDQERQREQQEQPWISECQHRLSCSSSILARDLFDDL